MANDPVQPESRMLVRQLMKHPDTETHKQCDEWVSRRTKGAYRSMLAVVEGPEADVENRRGILRGLAAILNDGDLIKLEQEDHET